MVLYHLPIIGDNDDLLAFWAWISSKLPDRCSLRVIGFTEDRLRWWDGRFLSLKELEEPAESFKESRVTNVRFRVD